MDEKIFGHELINDLEKQGLAELKSCNLAEAIDLPKLLWNNKVLGDAMLLIGRK